MAMGTMLDRLVGRLERAKALDPVADRLSGAVQVPLKAKPVRDLASGTPIGHPAHPMLVSVPIGAFVTASYLDFSRGRQVDAARRLVGLGLLSAVPTALTGAADWSYTTGAERRVGVAHAAANWLALGTYLASWQARRLGRHGLGAGLALGGAGMLSVGGWLGGHLSYARGVGVDTTAFSVAPEEWEDVLAETDLPDGQPAQVSAAGVPVLLVRQGDRLLAIDDRCTHRGAPLHEGTVADGCVTCPWHDSVFALSDGAVVTGPATRPQRRWEVRTRYGMIQLRVSDEPGSLRTNPVS